MGDLQAMVGACRIAERRLRDLFERYGLETVRECVTLNLDRCEARMRAEIAKLPRRHLRVRRLSGILR